jgi:hydroxybutyrate-dimer hydrolase
LALSRATALQELRANTPAERGLGKADPPDTSVLYQSTMAVRALRSEHPGMTLNRVPALIACLALAACATVPAPNEAVPMRQSEVRQSVHRAPDDLLSAGLGLAGLQQATPPAVLDASAPTAEELRRRALWANWRGIADLSPGGGFGEVYGALPNVPGREFHALAWLPEARHPHRVMLQLPDAFDARARCLLVTASSGSRGIYGAISLAGIRTRPRRWRNSSGRSRKNAVPNNRNRATPAVQSRSFRQS